jgi:hypothetical protein
MQVRCFNHMINLVFWHVIQDPVFMSMVAFLPARYHILWCPGSLEILRRRCPTLIQTKWAYLVDVPSFIMNHLAEVQTALYFAGKEQILQTDDFAYIA